MDERRKIPPSMNVTAQWKMPAKLKKALYLELSKYLLDISKLVFGGIILTMVINADLNKITTFVCGCISVLILITIGFILYKKGKE